MPVTPRGFGLGLIPDERDDRDRFHAVAPVTGLPEFVDLEPDPATPPIWDQSTLGSCTSHGTLACFLWASAKCGANDPMLSRLQLYWNTRKLMGPQYLDQDSGGQIRDAIKATTMGIAPESDWPYDIARFAEEPPAQAVKDAADNIGLEYARVEQSSAGIRTVLAGGHPVDIGVTLYASFEAPDAIESGVVDMPSAWDAPVGGHCMAVFGYGTGEAWKAHNQFPAADDNVLYAKIRNSWGTGVYQRGYLLMPLEYLTDPNLGQDYWSLKRVS